MKILIIAPYFFEKHRWMISAYKTALNLAKKHKVVVLTCGTPAFEKLTPNLTVYRMRDLFLPILIIRRRELGSGVYAVAGELIDEYVVARAIGAYDGSWLEYLENRKNPLYIYKPQLLLLRKKLRTATVIGFA